MSARLGLALKIFPTTHVPALSLSSRYLALESHKSILKTSYFQIGILEGTKYFVPFVFIKSLNRDVFINNKLLLFC